MEYFLLEPEDSLRQLESSAQGLSQAEVKRRLAIHGPNELAAGHQVSWFLKVIEPFRSPYVLILLVAAAISLLTRRLLDAAVVLAIVILNAVIYYVQRSSADHALAALKRHDKRTVKVMRDGKVRPVDATLLVPGDVALLYEGLKIPADGRLLSVQNLLIDESVLTGESLPATKAAESLKTAQPIYDQTNMVFKGTFVRGGAGEFVVTATGNQTELGRIASLSEEVLEDSPLQKKIGRLTSRLVVAVLIIAGLTFLLSLYRGMPVIEALRFVVSLTVSAVPEGLPVALTIVFIFGIKRMARKKALVRNLAAVETLGQATLIATDKTGTLTLNELAIAKVWHPANNTEQATQAAWLALAGEQDHADDPLEKVIAKEVDLETPKGWQRTGAIPFDQALRMSGSVWHTPEGYVCYIKGAPEVILAATKVSPAAQRHIEEAVQELSGQGFRLIGLASKPFNGKPHELTASRLHGFTFEGVLAFSDQLRPEVQAAVATTHRAGIRVLMLTGDHLETAKSLGTEAGIMAPEGGAAEGRDLNALNFAAVRDLLSRVSVFARVLPEHKHKILESLKGREITVMTGDGVNDVPAIVRADVGLAMGNGTDAAKEASDVILLDSNFATIVEAIREGRAIVANVRKMLFYLFATNLGELFVMIGALIIGLPLPLTAVQILWVNLVTDGFTVIPLGLEPAERKHMEQPPDAVDAPILRRNIIWRVITTALIMAAITLTVFWFYLPHGLVMAQTMAFVVLVVTQWANALNARSEQASFLEGFRRPNYLLWGAIVLSMLLQAAVFFAPAAALLGIVPIELSGLSIMILAAVAVLATGDLLKRIWK